ncbi:hypothetical protein BAUCODRAFT_125440 [Baudoinia panamericana UAMH 10762]|uniref:Uncharacterized protein n=1 Tax=Baudoinia panamericana (strain UAMH 10762) TaxID=717646 RepID=M2N3L5_BAUPA|nr:uncharacterized protein BAUCODRAFT_125440 [Baudoinia panamericana UAMH 10762]EMC93594.1 hypothetical protein BAUCODRAFT_125440 [Baudoinia panamericana UAMH 10762]
MDCSTMEKATISQAEREEGSPKPTSGLPAYSAQPKPVPFLGASGQNPWNDSGYAFPASTNVMDPTTMPSEKAEAARQRAAEIMAALKSGHPGAADVAMGKAPANSSSGLFGLRMLKHKVTTGKPKDRKQKQEDTVIR